MNADPVKIYQEASTRIPAYRKYLTEKLGEIPKVKSVDDFKKLPFMNKTDYIKRYPLDELCLDGKIAVSHIFLKSSGTSGKPFYWPVLRDEEKAGPEGMLRFLSGILSEEMLPTLVIIAFPIGSWSTGITTACSFKNLALFYPGLSVVTPGYDSDEVLSILENLSPFFRQTIILTFPPYAKSIMEEATERGLPVLDYNIMMIVGGEGISEKYRDYTMKYISRDHHKINAIWSIYGSADFGDVGFESHSCLAVRRILFENDLSKQILGTDEIPMIFQGPPSNAFFEIVDDEMVVSRIQGASIVRYKTGDHIDIIEYNDMVKRLSDAGYDIDSYLKCKSIHPVLNTPFVLLYGRVDGAIFFYGAYITVDQVRCALESPVFSRYYNGKFLIKTIPCDDGESIMELTLEDNQELRNANLDELSEQIAAELSRTQDQYKEFCLKLGRKAYPRINLAQSDIFKAGWKYRHIIRQ